MKEAAPGTDLFLIVGAPNSSNSKRLVEVAERAGAAQSLLVQRAAEIPWETSRHQDLSLSAGASAPEIIVDEIIEAFRERFDVKVELAVTVEESGEFSGRANAARCRADAGRHGFRQRGMRHGGLYGH